MHFPLTEAKVLFELIFFFVYPQTEVVEFL